MVLSGIYVNYTAKDKIAVFIRETYFPISGYMVIKSALHRGKWTKTNDTWLY